VAGLNAVFLAKEGRDLFTFRCITQTTFKKINGVLGRLYIFIPGLISQKL